MSAQTQKEVYAPIEARHRAQVMKMTWGHLAPRKNKAYRGHIVFAVGCFGDDPLNPTMLSAEFKGLDDSPWFFDAMRDFTEAQKGDPGNVYRFDGTFRNYDFVGKITTVYSSAAEAL